MILSQTAHKGQVGQEEESASEASARRNAGPRAWRMAIEHASAPDDWRRPRVDNTRLIARAWSEFGNYRSGGHIYTGYKRIARLCKRDESTVKRVTKDLEASGWLRQVYAGHGAMHRAAIWQLTIPDHGQLSTQSSGPKRSVTPVTDPPTTCLSSSPSGAGRSAGEICRLVWRRG
jgi:hypothetical protein